MKYTLLKKLISVPYSIIGMEVKNTSSVLDSFREHSSVSGEAVYIWKESIGLYRSDLPHVKIPLTQNYKQVLNYILKNNLNKNYVLTGFNKYIGNDFVVNTLKQLKDKQSTTCKIVIVDTILTIPTLLKGKILETKKLFKIKQRMVA